MTRNRRNYVFPLALLAVTVALAVPAGAQAGANMDRPSVAVRYDDLNLATDTGVRRLYARLRQAAARVCPDRYDRQPGRARYARACQAEAIDAAVAQVHSPRLAALHARDGARG